MEMEIENLEKNVIDEMIVEQTKLQEKMHSAIEGISDDAQVAANGMVQLNDRKGNIPEALARLECKQDLEKCLPGLLNPAGSAKRQLPPELVELYEQERKMERVLHHCRETIQALLDESANTKWDDIDTARRRATVLRQQFLQKKTEEERVRAAIEDEREKAARRVGKLTQLLDEMKQRKLRLQARQAEKKQDSKRLDSDLDRLVRELMALRTATNDE